MKLLLRLLPWALVAALLLRGTPAPTPATPAPAPAVTPAGAPPEPTPVPTPEAESELDGFTRRMGEALREHLGGPK